MRGSRDLDENALFLLLSSKYDSGLNCREIAEQTGFSYNYVRKIFRRGGKVLRKD